MSNLEAGTAGISTMTCDILERAHSAPQPIRIKAGEQNSEIPRRISSSKQNSGFPLVFHRSQSKELASRVSNGKIEKENPAITCAPIDNNIHTENLQVLSSMTPGEIEQAQKNLSSMVSDKALEAIRKRGLNRLSQESTKSDNNNAQCIDNTAKKTPSAAKLSGFCEENFSLKDQENNLDVFPTDLSEELPLICDTSKLSFHELVKLARSEVPPQRRAALREITEKLMHRQQCIENHVTPKEDRLPEMLPASIRLCLDTENWKEYVAALKALDAYLICPSDLRAWTKAPIHVWIGTHFSANTIRPQCTAEEQAGMDALNDDENENSDVSLQQAARMCYLDPVKGLLSMHLLPRLCSLIQKFGAYSKNSQSESLNGTTTLESELYAPGAVECLRILVTIARRGFSYSMQIISEPGLIDSVNESFLEPCSNGQFRVPLNSSSRLNPEHSTAVWAIRLVRALCQSSREITQSLILCFKNCIIDSSLNFLALGRESSGPNRVLSQVQLEFMLLWNTCLKYSYKTEMFDTILPLIQNLKPYIDIYDNFNTVGIQWRAITKSRSLIVASFYRSLVQLVQISRNIPEVGVANNTADTFESRDSILRPTKESILLISDRIQTISNATFEELKRLATIGCIYPIHSIFSPMLQLVTVYIEKDSELYEKDEKNILVLANAIFNSSGLVNCIDSLSKVSKHSRIACFAEWIYSASMILITCNNVSIFSVTSILASNTDSLIALIDFLQSNQVSEVLELYLNRAILFARSAVCQALHQCIMPIYPTIVLPIKFQQLLAFPFQSVSHFSPGDEHYGNIMIRLGIQECLRSRILTDASAQFLGTLYCSALCDADTLKYSRSLHDGKCWGNLESLLLNHGEYKIPGPKSHSLLPLPSHWIFLPLVSTGTGKLTLDAVSECLNLILALEESKHLYVLNLSPELKLYHLMAVCLYGITVLEDSSVTEKLNILLSYYERVCVESDSLGNEKHWEDRFVSNVEQLNVLSVPPKIPIDGEKSALPTYPGFLAFVTDLISAFMNDSCGHKSFVRIFLILLRPHFLVQARCLIWRELGEVGLLSLLTPPDSNNELEIFNLSTENIRVFDTNSKLIDAYITAILHKKFSSSSEGGELFNVACSNVANYLFGPGKDGKEWSISWGKCLKFDTLWGANDSISVAKLVSAWKLGNMNMRRKQLQMYSEQTNVSEKVRNLVIDFLMEYQDSYP